MEEIVIKKEITHPKETLDQVTHKVWLKTHTQVCFSLSTLSGQGSSSLYNW